MAKGIGVFGNARGRVGNVVGSVLDGRQIWRSYNPEVKNPQSMGQMFQRIKALPATNFYNGFADLLDHSWQGVAYGSKSRQYFMKLALSMSEGFPFVVKDDKTFRAGLYPISRGSIGSVNVSNFATLNNDGTPAGGWIVTTIFVGSDIPASESREISAVDLLSWLTSGGFLKSGDQLTFLHVHDNNPTYLRLVLDLNSFSSNMYEIVPSSNGFQIDGDFLDGGVVSGLQLAVVDGYLAFNPIERTNTGVNDQAAGIIVSRLNGSTWQRSNSVMYVTSAYLAETQNQAALNAAIASYKGVINDVNSEWYLNQGDDAQPLNMKIAKFYIDVPSGLPAPAGRYHYLGVVDGEGSQLGILTTTGTSSGKMIGFDGVPLSYSPVQTGAWRSNYIAVKWDDSYLSQLSAIEAPFENPAASAGIPEGGE